MQYEKLRNDAKEKKKYYYAKCHEVQFVPPYNVKTVFWYVLDSIRRYKMGFITTRTFLITDEFFFDNLLIVGGTTSKKASPKQDFFSSVVLYDN